MGQKEDKLWQLLLKCANGVTKKNQEENNKTLTSFSVIDRESVSTDIHILQVYEST